MSKLKNILLYKESFCFVIATDHYSIVSKNQLRKNKPATIINVYKLRATFEL